MAFPLLRIRPVVISMAVLLLTIGVVRLLQPDVLSAETQAISAGLSEGISIHASGRGRPLVNFADGRDLITAFPGDDMLRKVYPLSLASDDFDEDGVPDLVCGYGGDSGGVMAIHRGNIDSIYPNSSEARLRKARGESVDSPFLSPARLFSTPEPAALIATGDFDADGHRDVVAASPGGSNLYLFSGNGRGELGEPRAIRLPGRLTSMVAGEINRRDGLEDFVAGVETEDGARALVFEGPEGALRADPEAFDLPAAASSLALGQLDESFDMDLAVAAGGSLIIIHGRDRKLSLDEREQKQVAQAEVSEQAVGFTVRSMMVGDFAGDLESEIALLSEEGAVYLSNRLQAKWETEEMSAERWAGAAGMIKLRAATAKDALMVIDEAARSLCVIAGDGSAGKRQIKRQILSLDVESEPVAAIEMRLNGDAQSDIVILRSSESSPSVLMSQPGATFTVTNTNGFGAGSLFEAILDANETPGADTIAFNIPGPGPHTIFQTLELPHATEPVTVDGTTQPGFAGTPLIEVARADGVFIDFGLTLNSSNSAVRGMAFNRFNQALRVRGGNSVVEGNFIGLDTSGTANLQGFIEVTSSNNAIGGTVAAARNLLLHIIIDGGSGNIVQGNFIGMVIDGTDSLPIFNDGVVIQSSNSNTIGGTTAGTRNLINGAHLNELSVTRNSVGNLIQSNYMGVDVTGTVPLGGGSGGVYFEEAGSNTLGGTTAAARNIIAGNMGQGVFINGSSGVLVQGNYIGTDVTGTIALGNGENGVRIFSFNVNTTNNVIGGTVEGARNVISDSGLNGVLIEGALATGNSIQGNFIGVDSSGMAAMGNGLNGIATSEAPGNLIGGPDPGSGNVISANGRHGVSIGINTSGGATGITVQNNLIGTASDGTTCLGNQRDGVFVNLNSVGHTIIGNTIACNARNGVNVPNFANADPGIRINIASTIHSNALLGIDLGDAGVTSNDPKDPDIGANTLQNFPVLSSVTFSNGTLHIIGNLNSTPNTDFFVSFFSSSVCTGSNPGQDQQVLTALPILFHTDASGNAPIDLSLIVTPIGGWVNALATTADGNTSEFSPCAEINGSCSYSIDPTGQDFAVGGGMGTVTVTAGAGCNWTAVSNDSFITITSGIDGTGNGQVSFTVAANSGAARMGTMTIAGQTFTVNQEGVACTFSIAPMSEDFGAGGGSDMVSVTAPEGCDWTAASNDSFITITSGQMGSGNGEVNYSVAANTGPARSATMTIAGQTFTVNQSSGCLFSLDRTSQSFAANGGTGSINVTTSEGCMWTAVSDDTWIEITSGSAVTGTGSGQVQYTVASHTQTSRREGSITVAGMSFSVVQGAAFADVPLSHPFYTEIGKLSARQVTLGCDATNYCPDLTVTRQQMAAFIIRALGDFNPPPPAMQRFVDVPPANPFYAFIEQMALRQITLGCTANMYCPTDPVLRDQMAAFIIRALHEPGYIPPEPAMQRFADVPPSNPFYAHIEEMAVRQITLGCGGGNYCPSLEVSRGQMAAFLVRAFNL